MAAFTKAGFQPAGLQGVVQRNPGCARGSHDDFRNPTRYQPLQIPGETIENLHRIDIPVWGTVHEHFPGAQVDPGSILLQNRPVFQTPGFSSSLLPTLGRLRLLLLVVLLLASNPQRPSRERTLPIGFNPSKTPPDGYHWSAHGTWGQAANRARWHHCANGLLPLVASFQHASAHGHLRSSSPGQPPPPGNCC
jgi:hypothetical protein